MGGGEGGFGWVLWEFEGVDEERAVRFGGLLLVANIRRKGTICWPS